MSSDLLGDQHYFHWPTAIPLCSMRIATLNVNGAFHDLANDKAGTLAELMDAAQISVLGITDARILADRCQILKIQFENSGMDIFPISLTWKRCSVKGKGRLVLARKNGCPEYKLSQVVASRREFL